MSILFRKSHIVKALTEFELKPLPLDLHLRNYFHSHHAIGSKDRKFIADTCYSLIRLRSLVDYFIDQSPYTWEKRVESFFLLQGQMDTIQENASIPEHVRLSFPKKYFERLQGAFPKETVRNFCLVSNTPAPTTIRVNLLKTSREKLYDSWKDLYEISLSEEVETAITFHKKINFFALEEFKQGLFEVQDEGSQLISSKIPVHPKDLILDYCAASGGKSLAIAPRMKGSGQLFLHDIRSAALEQAKKRLKRAGIECAQLLPPSKDPSFIKNKIDVLILDVPCSGSGTLRRNPDMKWKFTDQMLENLVCEQREIFSKAFSFVKKGGSIAYITCSIFPEENEQQVSYFLQHYPLRLIEPVSSWFPVKNGKDGFFLALFEKDFPPLEKSPSML